MRHIVFIYPYLTSYILPALRGMAESGRVKLDVIYGPLPSGQGFGAHSPFKHPNIRWIQIEEIHPFGKRVGMYQKGLLHHIYQTHPDAILIWANARYLSFWGVLMLGRMLGIPVYPRGHGLVKKKKVGILYRLMYKVILKLSHKYMCYVPSVKESLKPLTKNEEKLVVDYNTLYNGYPVLPDSKSGAESGIFYIGRVRPGCGVDLLVGIVNRLNSGEGFAIKLHIIGDGPLGEFLHQQAALFPWITYYGKEFDQKRISQISKHCRVGCVPGFMGLNVVHMMSLSLPVVSHNRLQEHMGPEPEYIQHGINGWLFNKEHEEQSLENAIRQIWRMPADKLKVTQENAFETYKKLSNPPFHERLLQILEA